MKRLLIVNVLSIIIFSASTVFSDTVDENLKNMTTQEVRNSTRSMINNGVPDDDAVKITKLMLEQQFKQEYILRAHEIVNRAKKDDLPLEPIMNKAYEGIAKQVQEKKVIQAMEKVMSRYRFAMDQAQKITEDQGQRDRIRDMIADCNAAGVRNEDIQKVTNEFQQRSRQLNKVHSDELAEECFNTLRLMARSGIHSGDSADLVCEALKNRYTARDMNMMRNRFMTQYKETDPTYLAKQYKSQMQNGIDPGDLNGGGESGSGHDSPGGYGNSGESNSSGSSGGSSGSDNSGHSGGSGGSSGHGGNGGNGGK